MLSITKEQFDVVKLDLLKNIEDKSYFSGKIKGDLGNDISYEFILQIVIYRKDDKVTDIIPVWYEFHTFVDDNEINNDFLFSVFRTLL